MNAVIILQIAGDRLKNDKHRLIQECSTSDEMCQYKNETYVLKSACNVLGSVIYCILLSGNYSECGGEMR